MDSTIYCGGWVDLYYLPKAFWSAWSTAVNIIHKNQLVNEIGVVVAWRAMLHTGCKFELIQCWGSCCVSGSIAEMGANACGHRMDLKDPKRAIELALVWKEQTEVHRQQLSSLCAESSSGGE